MSAFPQDWPRVTRALWRVFLAFVLLAVMGCCLWDLAFDEPSLCPAFVRGAAETPLAIRRTDPSDQMLAHPQPRHMTLQFIRSGAIEMYGSEQVFAAVSALFAHEIRFLLVPVGCQTPPSKIT